MSIVVYVADMILNFVTQRQEMGKTKKNIKDIAANYLSNEFIPDIISLFMFLLSFIFGVSNLSIILLVVAVIKLNKNIKKF